MDWKRGAYPEFEVEDIVAAMFLLRKPTGRKSLADALGLGEGSVRTMLRKMNALKIITSTQRGHVLSVKGKRILESMSDLFSEAVPVGTVEGFPAVSLRISKPPVFKSVELRDEAIRYSARGAIILEARNGTLVFPEDGRPLSQTLPELYENLKELKFKDGDLVIVTWADKPSDALKSAYHMAVFLKRDEFPPEIGELLED